MRTISKTDKDLEEKFAKLDLGSADDYPDHQARQAVSESYVAANTVSAETGGRFDNRTGFTGHVDDEDLLDPVNRADNPTIHYETVPGETNKRSYVNDKRLMSTSDEDV
ncbi:hypothetical protein [Herminiimonas fonticola]|uniref:Uncharacterized protein n=1 Tax=Herminiimonas fonticola TaxID=303380 RepID=A0A4R6G7R2_9BURK|nr:hypothetical protein [Herminiimonas fonticola]RBA23822.1 hypothetical protein Hfont_1634 [Herminiimonas fonticola]TDN89824.1 hypothetical protein EV677_1886 [Herminiimonas fonticola]